MKKTEEDGFQLGEIIRKSILTIPDKDFEEKVIQLYRRKEYKRNLFYLKYALLCFIVFVVLGLFISLRLNKNLSLSNEIQEQDMVVIFQVCFIICFLIGAEYSVRTLKQIQTEYTNDREMV